MASFFSYAGAVWWSVATAFFCATLGLGLAQSFVQRRRSGKTCGDAQPPISAIIPIKLLDPGFETAQASMFGQDYPTYEVLIGAAEQESPALDAARRIAASHPAVSCRFLRSAGTAAVSPKLNNLAPPLASASHDLVFTKDSNITLDPDAMAAFVQNFTQGVGLVVGVPVAVRARNFAGRIEAFSINGHARLLLTASALGLGFGVGKAMLFRRSDLAKAGGIAAISDTLAEDTAISIVLARQGLKTVFSHRTVAQETGARTYREIYERQLRWSIVRRKHERVTFPLEPLASPLPAAVAGALAAPLVSYPAWLGFSLTLLLWFCAETGFALCKGWRVSAWSPLAFLGREILALVAWLRAFTTHDVVWAQVRFDARQGARAAPWDPAALPSREAGERRDSG
ncbi:MAG: glycosyltransferase [Pseudomonadota bacterium]|nr:glycosyltransferase [Pseudomonadota bacterium]